MEAKEGPPVPRLCRPTPRKLPARTVPGRQVLFPASPSRLPFDRDSPSGPLPRSLGLPSSHLVDGEDFLNERLGPMPIDSSLSKSSPIPEPRGGKHTCRLRGEEASLVVPERPTNPMLRDDGFYESRKKNGGTMRAPELFKDGCKKSYEMEKDWGDEKFPSE